MSMARVKSKIALKWNIDILADGGKLRLWTFTLPTLKSVKDGCKCWSELSRVLVREVDFQGVRVFELHQNHGLHVHCVVNKFYPVTRLRVLARSCGWGRIHVTRCQGQPYYVSKYVSKGVRDGSFKGRRLWASFGAVRKDLNRIKDVVVCSAKGRAFKVLEENKWLKAYRKKFGRLSGVCWRRYLEEANRVYWAWLLAPPGTPVWQLVDRWAVPAGFEARQVHQLTLL